MVISEKAHAECVRLLDLLTNKRVQESWSWVFMSPVTDIPGYHDIIKKPMDLGTVKKNLGAKPSRCRFKSHDRFAKDVRLVFQNALVYNKVDEHVKGSVYDAAQHLLRVFETAYAKAKETVFQFEEDDAAEGHASSTNEEQDTAAHGSAMPSDVAGSTAADGSSSLSSKHKKEKKEKKEKKAKKSKKKSKDKDKERDKDRSKDKHRKSSSSSTSGAAPAAGTELSTTDVTASRTTESSQSNTTSSSAVSGSTQAAGRIERAPSASSAAPSTPAVPSAASASGKMSEEMVNTFLGVLMKLIKYKEGNVSPAAPFLQPVDLTHFPDYKIKVPNRMHLYGVQKKLRNGGYPTPEAFAFDVRLVFSNCLVYNSDVVLSKVIRSHAITLLKLFESQFAKIGGSWTGLPDRWKCHQIIHDILAHRTDGHETAQWFKYPIETYFDSPDQIPYGYFKKIRHPMDLGTVSARLHLGTYRHVSEFLQDLQLIFDNCIKYWTGDPQGVTYCASAKLLIGVLRNQATAAFGSHVVEKAMKDKSSRSSSSATSSTVVASSSSSTSKDRKSSSSSATSGSAGAVTMTSSGATEEDRSRKRSSKHLSSSFPEKEVALEILRLLRQHKMRGYRGMEILTAGPFLHAVDITKYPDYIKVVSEPMDFTKIERKLKSDRYSDVNEFSADVHLIFTNCHKYNSDPVEGADIRAMATNLRDYFVALYNEKLGNGEKATLSEELAIMPSARASLEAPTKKEIPASKPSALTSAKPNKPTPVTSPPTRPGEASAAPVAPRAVDPPKPSAAVAPTTTTTGSASSSASIGSGSTGGLAAAASSSSSSKSKDKSQMTPEELEEYRRRKKERKEKKDKKDKKKKDKKEKKKKDKGRRDRPSRDDDPSKPTVGTAVTTTSSHPLPPVKAPTPAAPVVTGAAASVARTAHAASKTSPADAPASKTKSKKSKKSDLTGWEAAAERVLNRLAKIEQVAKLHFDKPLLEVFPQREHEYRRLVPEPIDLRTLREKLHAHAMASATEFLRLGRLIFRNAIAFNCAPDLASVHVREMSAHLLWYFESLCAEYKIGTEAQLDAAAALATMRRERAELVSAIPMEVKAKECQKLLRVLNSQKYDKNCWPFRKPVQVLFPTLSPEYFEIIKSPMDLATIADKLAAFDYKVHGDFIRDVRLTFENAIKFNQADKDREGWNVYSAAAQMLVVVEDQWCEVTLDVTEKVRRREILRKERDRLGEKRPLDVSGSVAPRSTSAMDDSATRSNSKPSASSVTSSQDKMDAAFIAKASITIAPSATSKGDPESATKLKLQLVNRTNLDRMNKSERKAEEKRRKRERREEELAKSEKRRRTAVAATDEALREAELRSRRRIQKLEITNAIKQREERERQAREEEEAKALATKMKLNQAAWTGKLSAPGPGKSFWLRKPAKLHVPSPFQAAMDHDTYES